MPRGLDQALLNEFAKICACPNEEERIKQFIDFFKIPISKSRISDYTIIELSTGKKYVDVETIIKDNSTGITYSAKYENNTALLKYHATHVKHRILYMSYPNNIEREFTYSRFADCEKPIHEEIHTIQENKYRLVLIRKSPEAYLPYEQGDYVSLSEIMTGNSLFYTKLLENEFLEDEIGFKESDYTTITGFFIAENKSIFERIMKKLNG